MEKQYIKEIDLPKKLVDELLQTTSQLEILNKKLKDINKSLIDILE